MNVPLLSDLKSGVDEATLAWARFVKSTSCRYCEPLFFLTPVSRLLSRCLVTPLIASPFEPDVLNILTMTGLAAATAPPTA